MSRLEKHAWFNIIVLVVAWLLFVAFHSLGVFGLLGFWGLAPFLFYPKGIRISKILDERERRISRCANATAFGIFWVLFIGSFMLVWHLHRDGNVTVPADFLPLYVLSAGMLVVLIQSITMLVLSKRGFKHAE